MIDKFYKNLQGLIYQFLEPKEVMKCEQVCKKVSLGAKQDYIWRYLSEIKLQFSYKYYHDTWKQSFWRNSKASERMTPDNFNYSMCPIRHFQSHITFLECQQNFIFAADSNGVLAFFLISEEDLENENESMKKWSTKTEGVVQLKFLKDIQTLVVITSDAKVITFTVLQTGVAEFDIVAQTELQIEMKVSFLYATYTDNYNFVICNFPMSAEHFEVDQTISIFDAKSKQIIYQQQTELLNDGTNNMQQLLRLQNVNQYLDDRGQHKLATFNGSRLIMAMFCNQLLVVDTQLSKLELFLKKSNYQLVSPYIHENPQPVLTLLQISDILLVVGQSQLNMFNYNTLQHTHHIQLNFQLNYQLMLKYNERSKMIWIHGFAYTNYILCNYGIDFANKKLVQKEENQANFRLQQKIINDVDMNDFVLARGSSEASIEMIDLSKLQSKPYFLNTGSRSVKTYKSHPTKEGLSMVRVTPNKIVAVLGNLIRVYSFDLNI